MSILNVDDVLTDQIVVDALTSISDDERTYVKSFVTDFISSWAVGLEQLEKLTTVDGFHETLSTALKLKIGSR